MTGPPVVRLDQLCLMPGCLELRADRNLCSPHADGDTPPERHLCQACRPRGRR